VLFVCNLEASIAIDLFKLRDRCKNVTCGVFLRVQDLSHLQEIIFREVSFSSFETGLKANELNQISGFQVHFLVERMLLSSE
jgi:hypothetical protein